VRRTAVLPYVDGMTDGVALLLRRATFGPTSFELATARRAGYAATLSSLTTATRPDRGAAASPLPDLGLDPYSSMPNPTPKQQATADGIRRQQYEVITRWWLDRMTVADHQLTEKLLFFWQGHWATSIDKVMSPQLMLRQHMTLRSSPDFATMARAMVRDPALVYWLDGQTNTKTAPNENLGRELMELFMLGIGNYTERDVKEAGRALTGWWVNLGGEISDFDPQRHDFSTKTILGQTADFTALSLVDQLLRQPACPRFIARRLWFRYASSTNPMPASTEATMIGEFPVPVRMLRALFADEAFQATGGQLVKQPIEWLIGALRQLGMRPSALKIDDFRQVVDGLTDLGQVPFAPPSVGGWPAGAAWLTSAAVQVRLGVAWKIAELASTVPTTPDGLADTLAIDTWSDRTYAALRSVSDPRLLLTLGLASPEYLVS
jgi:uncharacterized protein (DUF1800 family)